MFSQIENYINEALAGFETISPERKKVLGELSAFIQSKVDKNEKISLIYICTHNSRRSHFGQIWAKVAAYYYGFTNIETYSGGTEATAFNSNAIAAIQRAGFEVSQTGDKLNPHYHVVFDENGTEVLCFSKCYDDQVNPKSDFAAVMTCNDADGNCPFIPGAAFRVATPYVDPKKSDGTPEQEATYNERSKQIATECLYVFSLVKK
jgi:protein-tyrosine phosphatase/arsenate reductase